MVDEESVKEGNKRGSVKSGRDWRDRLERQEWMRNRGIVIATDVACGKAWRKTAEKLVGKLLVAADAAIKT